MESVQLFFKEQLSLSAKSLRCAAIDGGLVAVGSFDKKIHLIDVSSGRLSLLTHFDFLDSEPYSMIMKDNIIYAGLKSGDIIFVSTSGDLQRVVKPHTSVVNSIDLQGFFLASGSWDGLCVVTNISNGEKVFVSEPAQFAVTVRFLASGHLLAGYQTGEISLFAPGNFQLVKKAKCHDDIVRAITPTSFGFFSTSNDLSLRLWDNQLNLLKNFDSAHSSFIYTGTSAALPVGSEAFVTGGEDFSIRVFDRTKEVTRIDFPTTLWKLLWDGPRGQLLSFGEDGQLRVFSFSQNGVVAEAHQNYLQQALVASTKNPELAADDLKKFDTIDKMPNIKGKKEGEIRVFVNAGKAEAYCWQGGAWQLVGEVMSSAPKTYYAGDKHFPEGEYDFVFDIEDKNGIPHKLPFNRGDNALLATEKFLARESMSVAYKEQISQYLIKNARPQETKTISSHTPDTNRGPAYPPAQTPPPSTPSGKTLKCFPVMDPVYYPNCNQEGLINAVVKINSAFTENPDEKPRTMNFHDLIYFKQLVAKVAVTENNFQSTILEEESALLEKKLLLWNNPNALPILDLIRTYALHQDSQRLLNSADAGLKYTVFAIANTSSDAEINYVLAFKIIANYFKHNPIAFVKAEPILSELITMKASKISRKAITILFNVLNNLTCYMLEFKKLVDFKDFLHALSTLDLSFFADDVTETLNFLIPIGNILSLNIPEVNLMIKQSFGPLIVRMQPDSQGFLEDIKAFLA